MKTGATRTAAAATASTRHTPWRKGRCDRFPFHEIARPARLHPPDEARREASATAHRGGQDAVGFGDESLGRPDQRSVKRKAARDEPGVAPYPGGFSHSTRWRSASTLTRRAFSLARRRCSLNSSPEPPASMKNRIERSLPTEYARRTVRGSSASRVAARSNGCGYRIEANRGDDLADTASGGRPARPGAPHAREKGLDLLLILDWSRAAIEACVWSYSASDEAARPLEVRAGHRRRVLDRAPPASRGAIARGTVPGPRTPRQADRDQAARPDSPCSTRRAPPRNPPGSPPSTPSRPRCCSNAHTARAKALDASARPATLFGRAPPLRGAPRPRARSREPVFPRSRSPVGSGPRPRADLRFRRRRRAGCAACRAMKNPRGSIFSSVHSNLVKAFAPAGSLPAIATLPR